MSLTLLLGPLDAEDPILQAFFVGDMVGKDSLVEKCVNLCPVVCYVTFSLYTWYIIYLHLGSVSPSL